MIDGKLQRSFDGVPKGAQPNLRLLSDFLRGDQPIPNEIRIWLADLFDPSANTSVQVKTLLKRKPGRQTIDHFEAVHYFNSHSNVPEGPTRQQLLAITQEKFGINSTSTLEAALANYKDAEDAIEVEQRDSV